MQKNKSGQYISFHAVSASDGSDVTSGSPAVYYTIDNGTQSTGSGSITHKGSGEWSYSLAQSETNGDHIAYTFVLGSAISQTVNVYPVAFDPTDVADLGVTALTGHTPQTGDSFARLGAPAGASVSADIATVDGVADSILVDTNELQTDWANGGRLDLILDARASQASVDTVDSNVDAILVDTNELQTDWADGGRLDAILDARASQTSVDTIDGIVDSILDDTGTSGVLISSGTGTGQLSISSGIVDANMEQIDTSATAAANLALSTGVIIPGAAVTGTLSATQMSTDLTESTDDHYNGCLLIFTSGNLLGQRLSVTDYNGTSKVLTFSAATESPADGDDFILV